MLVPVRWPNGCHTSKTLNQPSRLFWVRKFGVHCALYGYSKQLEKCVNEEAVLLMMAQQRFSTGSNPTGRT